MAATPLPLKIRIAVRDKWDNPSSAVQVSIAQLSELLGQPVSVEIDWEKLVPILVSNYRDSDTLIPSISNAVTTSIDTLQGFLDDEEKEAWSDNLLTFTATHGRKLVIRVQTCSGSQFRMSLSEAARALILSIPEDGPLDDSLSAIVHDSLRGLFKGPASSLDDDSFEHIPQAKDLHLRVKETFSVQSLPALDQIARPEDLFEMRPPYHLLITEEPRRIVVQSSHQPSLQLMSNYFKKWSRKLRGDTRNIPSVSIELRESHFGHGIFFDTLVFEPTSTHQHSTDINIVLFLAFAKNVLGYHAIAAKGDKKWHFERDEAYV